MTAPPRPALATRLVLGLAATKLALQLAAVAVTPYGVHRDEFLYLAMGRHLQLWRMDFPPLIAILAEAARALPGEGLLALRLFPALFGTVLVVLAALIAREMDGGRFAQGLAALAVIANPLFLRSAALFQPVVLDQVAWTLGLYALVRLAREERAGREPRWWLLLGAAGGLGLLAKFSILFFGLAVLVGILLSPLRRAFRGPWPYVALLLALVIGSPSLVGQLRLDFPVMGQMRDLQEVQLQRVTAAEFIGEQFLYGPATVLALAGLAGLLAARSLRTFRVIGWTCLAAFAILLVLHGKGYYVGPVYPALVAAGAVLLERVDAPRVAPLLRGGAVAALVLYLVLVLPLGLPVLPPATLARYTTAIGLTEANRTNRGEMAELPQDFADMLGWEAQVRAVARVYHALPPARRAEAVILGGNYGEAGALDYYGPRYGLPPAISTAGTYWHFGPGGKPGRTIVSLGVEPEDLAPYFDSVRVAARVNEPWVVAEERNVAVVVASGGRYTLQEVWHTQAGDH